MTDTLVRPEDQHGLKTLFAVDFENTLEKSFNAFAKEDEKKVGKWSTAKNDHGATVLARERMPVFRSGEFSDSLGRRHKWMSTHMRQMIDHYSLLKESGQFVDVPIRRGHGSMFGDPIDSLIGYITNLSMERRASPVDGNEYDYLLADVEIIDPQAQEKINSGLWRNVSSEIGMYIDNDEAEYWPVFKGFAYVDIPAVEGLKEYSKSHPAARTIIEGEAMTGTTVTPAAPKVDDAKHAQSQTTFAFTINGEATTDFSKVQNYIKQVEGRNAELTTQVNDLAEFKKNSITKERESFIDQLAKDGKIGQPQVEDAKEFAKGMTDEQFEMYKKMNEASAPMPLLQEHGVQQSAPVGSTPSVDEQKSERIEVLKEMVSAHSATMTAEALKEMPSYKELMQLDPSFSLGR